MRFNIHNNFFFNALIGFAFGDLPGVLVGGDLERSFYSSMGVVY